MIEPEGSDGRRHARMTLINEAQIASRSGCSWDGFCERADQSLIDAVSERDLESVYQLVWTKKPLRMR